VLALPGNAPHSIVVEDPDRDSSLHRVPVGTSFVCAHMEAQGEQSMMKLTTVRVSCVYSSLVVLAAVVSCGGPQKSDATPAASASTLPPALPPAEAVSTATLPPEPSAAANPTAPSRGQGSKGTTTAAADYGTPVTIAIEPRSGATLKGTARFEPSAAGVKINIEVTGAPPGAHGTHIHETADCSDKDAKSAGDHYNPRMHEHGLPPTDTRHLGDLGNIEVSKDGKGHLEIMVASANMKRGDKLSFWDRAVIVHAKPDDGSQPSGNSGKRIGCGEIK